MKIVKAGFQYLTPFDGTELLKSVERAGRLCYQSMDKITDTSYEPFIRGIIRRGHTSVLEHASIGVVITTDRGVTHELVRHRLCSFSQESTRYCNYASGKFGKELTFIKPCFWNDDDEQYVLWERSMRYLEEMYLQLIRSGASPQEARTVLPNSLAAKIAVTANLREWRHIFGLRCDKAAHPQMREIMLLILEDFHKRVPVVFDDLFEKFENDIGEIHAMRED